MIRDDYSCEGPIPMSICRSAAEFLARSAILFPVFALWFSASTAAQTSFELRSPDNRIQVRIRASAAIQYDVLLGGRTLLENSTFSLDIDHKKLGPQPKVIDLKERASDQRPDGSRIVAMVF